MHTHVHNCVYGCTALLLGRAARSCLRMLSLYFCHLDRPTTPASATPTPSCMHARPHASHFLSLLSVPLPALPAGIDVEKGWSQIVTEFIPLRTEQLLGGLYGPNGTRPLLPAAQPADAVRRGAASCSARMGAADGSMLVLHAACFCTCHMLHASECNAQINKYRPRQVRPLALRQVVCFEGCTACMHGLMC